MSGRRLSKALAAAVAWVMAAGAAQAEIVELGWDAGGRFERTLDVAPGKFAEVCGKLARPQSVAWSFDADRPMNFNIHYHEGKKVVYPEKRDATAAGQGTLKVAIDQDYCWMWTNKSEAAARLKLVMSR